MLLLRVGRPFIHACILSFIVFLFHVSEQAHLIHLNYVIMFQDGNIFPASKVVELAGRGGSCI